MTLTLEQVRQTRFHLARRNGYEPVDVDNFVDAVEATLAQMSEENAALTKQIEALKASDAHASGEIFFDRSDDEELTRLRAELEAREFELVNLRDELNGLKKVLDNAEGSQAAAAEQISASQKQALEQVTAAREDAERRVAAAEREANDRIAAAEEAANQRIADIEQAATSRVAAAEEKADQVARQLDAMQGSDVSVAAGVVPMGRIQDITIRSMAEAGPIVANFLQTAVTQAQRTVDDAESDAAQRVADAERKSNDLINEANRKAHETITDARTRSERIESDARVNAENMVNSAQAKAETLNSETLARRAELLSVLEAERDGLIAKVDGLRNWEDKYRSSITSYLQKQLDAVASGLFDDSDIPDLLKEPRGSSATPRLDALLQASQEG